MDRPGLDALRDAAETGLIDAAWCLSPDRLARVYAYQVTVLDELARHGVKVFFADAPQHRRRPPSPAPHPAVRTRRSSGMRTCRRLRPAGSSCAGEHRRMPPLADDIAASG